MSLPPRKVEVTVDGVRHPRWEADLPRFCSRALREAGYATWDISFLLCGDKRMTELNARYRGKKTPTDVLSFPRDARPRGRPPRQTVETAPRETTVAVAGDLAISLETMRRNAAAFGCTEDEELKRLTVHGLLHLAGMDHGRGRGGPMLELQERLLEGLHRVHVIRGPRGRAGGAVGRERHVTGSGPAVALLLAGGAALFGADARAAYLAGAAAQGVEDYSLAVEKYKEALVLNPAYLDPMTGLAESFLLLEEYDEAARYVAMARSFDPSGTDLQVLQGRIFIGQGRVADARGLFNAVLAVQPNNVEARLGNAEADIADGRPKSALTRYVQALGLAPESTSALLSLALLSDESGDSAGAGRYYELALKTHSADARVQVAAAAWYDSTGNFDAAEKHAQIALSLSPGLDRASVLLGQVYLETGRFTDAVKALGSVVSANRDDALAWYALGLAYRGSGDTARALSSFASALQARPDDEMARIAQEATAIQSLPLGDPQRQKMALFHLGQGQEQEQRSYLEKALAEYRRALILDPTSRDARVAYARIYRTLGYPAKFLSELQVLAKLGVKDTFVSDQIESTTARLSGSVSRAWGYDQYNIDRRRYVIPVYTLAAANRLTHALSSDDTARYFGSLLGRYDSISVPDVTPGITGFDQAFSAARAAGTDYFIILAVDEADRSLSITADVYLSRTGGRIASFGGFRTGNDRVRDSFMKLASDVAGILSPRGSLLVRKFGQGLVDVGTAQGFKNGDKLVIVRQGGVRLRPDGPGLTYDDKDVLGDFTVTAADEAVAEGSVQGRGYFDYVNARDEVLSPVQKTPPPDLTPAQRSGNILTRLFRIGG